MTKTELAERLNALEVQVLELHGVISCMAKPEIDAEVPITPALRLLEKLSDNIYGNIAELSSDISYDCMVAGKRGGDYD